MNVRQQGDTAEEAAGAAWLWSVSKRQYVYASTGRVVPQATIERWLEKAIAHAKSNLRTIGEDLIEGRINRAEWAIRAGAELKNMHRALAMLANGGKAQMTNARWGRLGGKLQRQFAYFNRFAAQVDALSAEELQAMHDKFLRRLEMYAGAGRNTYWHAARALAQELGGLMERNVLGASIQSCEGCLAEEARGWVQAGELSSPGDRECGSNCNCDIEFKEVADVAAAEAAA